MVIQSIMQIAAAGPIGALFGLAYGTSIRIGYEIIFPALFGDKVLSKDVDATLEKMTTTFTAIGGLEAQKFGINTGIKDALKAINADPELMELIKKNSALDTQNISITLSGNLAGAPQEPSSPPSFQFDKELERIRSRYGNDWLHRSGAPTLTRDVAILLQREKSYLQGDKECVAQYGSGWRITGSLTNCKNAQGHFRPITPPTDRTTPDQPTITPPEIIERERKKLEERLSTKLVRELSVLNKQAQHHKIIIADRTIAMNNYKKWFGTRDPRYQQARKLVRDHGLKLRDILLVIKRKHDELQAQLRREQ